MRLEIRNIGKVRHADIAIDGITVIAAANNTGKSTLGKALYSLLSPFHNYDSNVRDRLVRSVFRAMSQMAPIAIKDSRSSTGVFLEETVSSRTMRVLAEKIVQEVQYGSGKSSILEKVVEDFEGVKPCSTKNISLAPLASCCGNAERRSDNNENRHGSKGPTDDFSTDTPTNRIQREIVKQLLYGVDPKDVPLSRFHRIHEKGKWEKIGFSLMTSVFLTMLLGGIFR